MLPVAVICIAYIFASGFVGGRLISRARPGEGVPAPIAAESSNLPDLFVRWDAGYDLGIAEHEYPPGGDERAYFPLYPATVGAVSRLTGLPVLWVATIIAMLAFTVAGLLFYRWVRFDFPHEQALLATVLMYALPLAFFFVAFYGEPLLLLFSIVAFYFTRRGRFVEGGLAIAPAGLVRPLALLLAVPYAVGFYWRCDVSRANWLR